MSVTFDADADVLAEIDARAVARYPERKRSARSMVLREILGLLRPGASNLEAAVVAAHGALGGGDEKRGAARLALEEVARVVSPRLHARLANARAREGA